AIPPGIRSEEEYERLQTALRKAERSVADSERALASARALTAADVEKTGLELEEARSKLRQVEGGIAALGVRAPQSGVLLLERNAREERLWETGDTIYPGEKLATLPDLSTLVVRARLFDVDDGAIEPGSAATVTLDPYPELEYTGTVRRVDAVAFQRERDSSTRVFWVIVDLDDVDPRAMRPGLSARVRVERQRTDGESVVVPRESMDLTDLAAPRVLLADGSWRAVTLGPCGPLECVVLAGIEAGAAVGRVTRFAPAGAVSEAR
ncbi:MAG TPA: HlyD family efflux transporter periplasmic adaptor subunit, partial [Thermoanaerobaculia bacterium]|nr:HlyD family efflux transporter periplasmic adaptor subunit [Thermoanaerobaculia bacterium]